MDGINVMLKIDDIKKLKKSLNSNNKAIIDKLNVLKKEYRDIPNILNTPNSNMMIPELYKIVDKYDKYINEMDNYFNNAINKYTELMNNIRTMVEGETNNEQSNNKNG